MPISTSLIVYIKLVHSTTSCSIHSHYWCILVAWSDNSAPPDNQPDNQEKGLTVSLGILLQYPRTHLHGILKITSEVILLWLINLLQYYCFTSREIWSNVACIRHSFICILQSTKPGRLTLAN